MMSDYDDELFDKLPKMGKLDIYERLGRILDANLSILTVAMENNSIISYLYGVVPLMHYTFTDSGIHGSNNFCWFTPETIS